MPTTWFKVALFACCMTVMPADAAVRVAWQNRDLMFAASELASGSSISNGFIVTGVNASSARGGRVSLVNTQAWSRHYSGPGRSDNAVDLVIDGAGSVCAVGQSQGTNSGSDFIAIRYAPDGTAIWTNRYDGGDGNDYVGHAGGLTLDKNGNTFVTGVAAMYYDAVAIKYGPDGAPLQTNRQTMSWTNVIRPFATADRAGNVYMSSYGRAVGAQPVTIKFDPAGIPVWTNYGIAGDVLVDEHENLFVGAMQPNGSCAIAGIGRDGRSLWTNLFRSDRDLFRTMEFDHEGNLIVSGEAVTSPTFSYVTIKYTRAGVPLWTNLLAGPQYSGGDFPQLLMDADNNVYVLGGTANSAGDDVDTTILKLNADGVPLWTNRLSAPNIGNGATGTSAMDAAGNLYVLANWNGGEPRNFDFLVAKYTADGAALWTNRYTGAGGGNDFAGAAEVDQFGNLYVGGGSWVSALGNAFLVIKYSDYIVYSPPADFVGEDVLTYTAVDELGNSVTGTINVTVAAPALRLTVLRHDASGLHLQADTPNQGGMVVLESSPDMVNWQPVLTHAASAGQLRFTDTSAANTRQRFYRVAQAPAF